MDLLTRVEIVVGALGAVIVLAAVLTAWRY